MTNPEDQQNPSVKRPRTLTWDQWIQQYNIDPAMLFSKLDSRQHIARHISRTITLLRGWQSSGEGISSTARTLDVERTAISGAMATALRVMSEPDITQRHVLIRPVEQEAGDPVRLRELLKYNYSMLLSKGLDLSSVLYILRGFGDGTPHDAYVVSLLDKDETLSLDGLTIADNAVRRVFDYINAVHNADVIQSKPVSKEDTDILIP